MEKIIKIITDENIGTETIKHLFNEVDYKVLKTEEENTFAITRRPKETTEEVEK